MSIIYGSFSQRGAQTGARSTGTPPLWVPLVQACTPGAGPALAGVLCVPPPGVTVSPRPPHLLLAELSPHCPWVHRAHTHVTHATPHIHTRAHVHTTHMAHVTHGGWAPACVGAHLGTRKAGGYPSNSLHQCKAPLLLQPAHTHVLGSTHTHPHRDAHPIAVPETHCALTLAQAAVHSHPSPMCRLVNTHMHKHACVLHTSMSPCSHTHIRDIRTQRWTWDCTTAAPHLTSATHPPTALSTPRAPGSSQSCVPGTRWGPQAARGLSLLQAGSLPWHILACHHPAVTLPQALPGGGFGTRSAGTVQLEWPVPSRQAWGSFPKVKEPSEGGAVGAPCPPPASPFLASVSPAWAAEQDGSPRRALHGHRDTPCGAVLWHRDHTHTRC